MKVFKLKFNGSLWHIMLGLVIEFLKALNCICVPVIRLAMFFLAVYSIYQGKPVFAILFFSMISWLTVGTNETKLERIEKLLNLSEENLKLSEKQLKVNQEKYRTSMEKMQQNRCQHKNRVGFCHSKSSASCLLCLDCKTVLEINAGGGK